MDDELIRLKDQLEEDNRREAEFRLACAQDFLAFEAGRRDRDRKIAERDTLVHQLHLAAADRESVIGGLNTEIAAHRQALQKARADLEAFTWSLRASEDECARRRSQEKTWGWKLCRPLRALQRRFAPLARPALPAETPGIAFTYYLPTSPYRIYRDERFLLKGWGFPNDGREVTGIRVRIDDREFIGRHGLAEPEIAARYGLKGGQALPGFEIEFSVPPGRHWLWLEARLEDDGWRSFLNLPVWHGL